MCVDGSMKRRVIIKIGVWMSEIEEGEMYKRIGCVVLV